MDERRQRVLGAWSVILLGFIAIVGVQLAMEGVIRPDAVGAYAFTVALAAAAGAIPLPEPIQNWHPLSPWNR